MLNTAIGHHVGEILGSVYGINAAFGDPRITINIGNPSSVLFAIPEQSIKSQTAPSTIYQALLVIEAKAPWALNLQNLQIIYNLYNEEQNIARAAGELIEKSELLKAVNRVYAYMALNNLTYGALTTYNSTYFFRRTNGESLRFDVSPEIKLGDTRDSSLIAAFVGLAVRSWRETRSQTILKTVQRFISSVPHSEIVSSKVHHSVFASEPLDPGFESFFKHEREGTGQSPTRNEIAVEFEKLISRNIGSTVYGVLKSGVTKKSVVLKVYDLSNEDIGRVCKQEVEM
ncbi:hypothetical protein ABW20_dc0105118 [Dactylellina cionopaga]|nr:hypothetical protein ABW20_dc0105118 [Dactylellina cionopaga]